MNGINSRANLFDNNNTKTTVGNDIYVIIMNLRLNNNISSVKFYNII